MVSSGMTKRSDGIIAHHMAGDVRRLYAEGHSKSAIARQLGISRMSVRRFIGQAVG